MQYAFGIVLFILSFHVSAQGTADHAISNPNQVSITITK